VRGDTPHLWGVGGRLRALARPFWRCGTGSSGMVEAVAMPPAGKIMPIGDRQGKRYMLHWTCWWPTVVMKSKSPPPPLQGVAV